VGTSPLPKNRLAEQPSNLFESVESQDLGGASPQSGDQFFEIWRMKTP